MSRLPVQEYCVSAVGEFFKIVWDSLSVRVGSNINRGFSSDPISRLMTQDTRNLGIHRSTKQPPGFLAIEAAFKCRPREDDVGSDK